MNEVSAKNNTLRSLELTISHRLCTAHDTLSSLDGVQIDHFIRDRVSDMIKTTKLAHDNKLTALGIRNNLDPCDTDKVIFNYSSTQLSSRLKIILGYGLHFWLPAYKFL